jgi:electron transfer flavoprotein beta subunit
MHIVVCVKQVPNPEVAASQFRVDEEGKKVVPLPGVPLVMSPFDEQGVEAALRIRDVQSGSKITVITMGPESARNVLKHGLAMGADEGVLLTGAAFEDSDGYTTALTLAAAIRKIGDADLVLAGRQAADDDAGIVGAGLGELLGLPVVAFAEDVRVQGNTVRVKRVLDDGMEVVEGLLPAVVTVSNELGEARKPSLRETMRAARKPIAVWSTADLGLAPEAVGASGARCIVERVFKPVKESRCERIAGASVQERAARLARLLREARLI